MNGYDHKSEYEQGREDAVNGFPRRFHQTAPYRQGYDRGLSEVIEKARRKVEV